MNFWHWSVLSVWEKFLLQAAEVHDWSCICMHYHYTDIRGSLKGECRVRKRRVWKKRDRTCELKYSILDTQPKCTLSIFNVRTKTLRWSRSRVCCHWTDTLPVGIKTRTASITVTCQLLLYISQTLRCPSRPPAAASFNASLVGAGARRNVFTH